MASIVRDWFRGLLRSRTEHISTRLLSDNAAQLLPKQSAPNPDRVPNFFLPLFWWTTDANKVEETMKSTTALLSPGYHFADNLLTWGRNMSMLDDAPFVAAWQANVESASDRAIVWRRYVLACAAYHCVQLDGDFVECGTATGVGVKTIVDYLGGPAFPKPFWGYDLFEYDASTVDPGMPDHGPGAYERVCAKFASYPQVRMVKGLIPEAFATACPDKIAYLHIDLNQAAAEIASLEHLFDRMVPGGILVLDDYEWAGIYRGQKLAEDIWFEARKYRVMPLPTGQGIVIKRPS